MNPLKMALVALVLALTTPNLQAGCHRTKVRKVRRPHATCVAPAPAQSVPSCQPCAGSYAQARSYVEHQTWVGPYAGQALSTPQAPPKAPPAPDYDAAPTAPSAPSAPPRASVILPDPTLPATPPPQ